jgi:hypothetical protein
LFSNYSTYLQYIFSIVKLKIFKQFAKWIKIKSKIICLFFLTKNLNFFHFIFIKINIVVHSPYSCCCPALATLAYRVAVVSLVVLAIAAVASYSTVHGNPAMWVVWVAVI